MIECALHGAQFDVRTGLALNEVTAEALRLCDVWMEAGGVWLWPPRDEPDPP